MATIEQLQATALICYARDVSRWLYRFSTGFGIINRCSERLAAALSDLESAIARNGRAAVLGAWDSIRRSSDPFDRTTKEVLELALDGKLGQLHTLAETPLEV